MLASTSRFGRDGAAQLDGRAVGRVRQSAGYRVVARPQPAKERRCIALRDGVMHVVAENRPLVGELVVDTDNVVAHIDRIGNVGEIALPSARVRLWADPGIQVEHGIRVE